MTADQGKKVSTLENEARTANKDLSEKLSTLLYEVQPKAQVDYLKDDLIYRAKMLQYQCMTTVDEARDGDPDARQKLLKVAGVGAGVVALLCLRRRVRRGRKK